MTLGTNGKHPHQIIGSTRRTSCVTQRRRNVFLYIYIYMPSSLCQCWMPMVPAVARYPTLPENWRQSMKQDVNNTENNTQLANSN